MALLHSAGSDHSDDEFPCSGSIGPPLMGPRSFGRADRLDDERSGQRSRGQRSRHRESEAGRHGGRTESDDDESGRHGGRAESDDDESGLRRHQIESEAGEDLTWAWKVQKLLDETPVPSSLKEALLKMMPLFAAEGLTELDITYHALACVLTMESKLPSLEDGLQIKVEHAATIHAYTCETVPTYRLATRQMTSSKRLEGTKVSQGVLACLPFYKLLQVSCEGLPQTYRVSGTVYRGVKWNFPNLEDHATNFHKHFYLNRRVMWYQPKSTTRDNACLATGDFCGTASTGGAGTVFECEITCGYSIEEFSFFETGEKEILVPLSVFKVKSAKKNKTVSTTHILDKKGNFDVDNPKHTGDPDWVKMTQVEVFPTQSSCCSCWSWLSSLFSKKSA